ncbi:hypothetical protein J6590_047531 [Homalodisca vitripennis]|nr:hypothetical protein J6590_047531 [Homalodisca vitripennis]
MEGCCEVAYLAFSTGFTKGSILSPAPPQRMLHEDKKRVKEYKACLKYQKEERSIMTQNIPFIQDTAFHK